MMKPTLNRLLVRVKPEVTPVTSDNKVVGKDKKAEAIPVVLPTVKGNTVVTAVVVDKGPGCREISKGDTVIFSPYGIDEVQINNEKLVILEETMVLAYERKK